MNCNICLQWKRITFLNCFNMLQGLNFYLLTVLIVWPLKLKYSLIPTGEELALIQWFHSNNLANVICKYFLVVWMYFKNTSVRFSWALKMASWKRSKILNVCCLVGFNGHCWITPHNKVNLCLAFIRKAVCVMYLFFRLSHFFSHLDTLSVF